MTLVERLSAATGSDKELGELVLLACDWHKCSVGWFYGPLYTWHGPKGEYFKGDDFAKHNPTASLDSAMTLVPDGHEWLRKDPGVMTVYRVPTDDKEWARHIEAAGATPALALCIASLRARESA